MQDLSAKQQIQSIVFLPSTCPIEAVLIENQIPEIPIPAASQALRWQVHGILSLLRNRMGNKSEQSLLDELRLKSSSGEESERERERDREGGLQT